MRKILIGLYGASGFGSEVMPLLLEQSKNAFSGRIDIDYYFIDSNSELRELNDIKVVDENTFLSMECDEFYFNIAISDSEIRKELAEIDGKGCKPIDIHANTTKILHGNQIGEGSILTNNTIVIQMPL